MQPSATVYQLIARFGCEVFSSYGMSECCGKISMSMMKQTGNLPPPMAALELICTSGHPFCMVDLRIMGASGVDARDADTGEVVCRGPSMFHGGYQDNHAATTVAFSNGWFLTGDVAFHKGSSNYLSVVCP